MMNGTADTTIYKDDMPQAFTKITYNLDMTGQTRLSVSGVTCEGQNGGRFLWDDDLEKAYADMSVHQYDNTSTTKQKMRVSVSAKGVEQKDLVEPRDSMY